MEKLKDIIAKKKAASSDTATSKRKDAPSDAVLLEDLRKRQRRTLPDAKPSNEVGFIPEREPEELTEADTTVITWMRRTVINIKDERKQETQRAVDELERRMQMRTFPAAVSEGMAKAAQFAESRKYKKAHEAYLEVAVGNAKWPIGVKGLQVKTRGCNDLIQPISHVLDQESNRDILTAFKRLLSAAQAANPSDDLAENVIL